MRNRMDGGRLVENNQTTRWLFIYSQDHYFAGRTSTNDLKHQGWVFAKGSGVSRENLDLGIGKCEGGGYISINGLIIENKPLSSYGSSVLTIGVFATMVFCCVCVYVRMLTVDGSTIQSQMA